MRRTEDCYDCGRTYPAYAQWGDEVRIDGTLRWVCHGCQQERKVMGSRDS